MLASLYHRLMFKPAVAVAGLTFMLTACTRSAQHMSGESLVLVGTTPAALLGTRIHEESVVLRSSYLPRGVTYEAGKDYRFDPRTQTLARVPGSRIPDFSQNMLYGKADFDHSRFPGYGNGKFFVFVDYR